MAITRKEFLRSAIVAAAAAGCAGRLFGKETQDEITAADLGAAEKLWGLEFTEQERALILGAVRSQRRAYDAVRAEALDYRVEPPTVFSPLARPDGGKIQARPSPPKVKAKPSVDSELAFMSIRDLGHLIRTKKLTSSELTRACINRLKKYGDELLCVVTLNEEGAMREAEQLDKEIAAGRYRGPLHGIPYGLKDLFATKGLVTTWGSGPHKEQMFDYDAAVVERLRAAGAVLAAKTSLGALAQGDVWFRGRTKNPWNTSQGSSGSSAGSAAAVSAGLVPFAIGTETLGSIMSPSHQCRVTGLRPTYGRVSRYGAMAVSWTMDKAGPICREADDCALVFAAIAGADPRDRTSVDASFRWPFEPDFRKLRVGYLRSANSEGAPPSAREHELISIFRGRGCEVSPAVLPGMKPGVSTVLGVEASAAFDEFTRSGKVRELKDSSWPETYRSNRYVPAVEYLAAQRSRLKLMEAWEGAWQSWDVVFGLDRGGSALQVSNYTGHPQLYLPGGADDRGSPLGLSLFAKPFREDLLLACGKLVQGATGHHLKRPPGFAG